jgi:hypothetical protein
MCRKYPCNGKCPRYSDFEAPKNPKPHIFVYNNISNMHCSYFSRIRNYFYLKLTSVVVLLLDSVRRKTAFPSTHS